jgi:solute carrier family 35 (UDP-sugar transporter), member A1/2/3
MGTSIPPSPSSQIASQDHASSVRVLALVSLAAVQVFAGLVLKLAQSGGSYSFSPQSSLAMSETVKLAMSGFYLSRESGGILAAGTVLYRETSMRLVLHMTGLAGLYAVNNALAFWLFARADPGAIMLTKATSSVVSAVMLYFARGFVVSRVRWVLLVIQMLGLFTAQYDMRTGTSTYSTAVYGVMMLTVVHSNAANVWNERVIQEVGSASMATKNIYLYGIGAALNVAAFAFARASQSLSLRFFEGYGLAATAVVTSNALIGLCMNVVYRYADALVKTIATSVASIAMLALSAVCFGGRADALVFVGGAILASASYVYFEVERMEVDAASAAPRKWKNSKQCSCRGWESVEAGDGNGCCRDGDGTDIEADCNGDTNVRLSACTTSVSIPLLNLVNTSS